MIDRVKKILEIERMSPSQFADEIRLQRSSLSHVLSGRNKPSLDFVTKIKKRFSEINLEWLIFGKGNMFLQHDANTKKTSKQLPADNKHEDIQAQINFDTQATSETAKIPITKEPNSPVHDIMPIKPSKNSAKRVIILYDDGTFDNYVNKV